LDADCLIVPDLVGTSYVRLSKYKEFIEAGERAAWEMLPTIREALEQSDELGQQPPVTRQPHHETAESQRIIG
jgi:hypothetical protein